MILNKEGEVNIIESDLGCGTNIDEVLVFGTVEAANVFIQEFNNVNMVAARYQIGISTRSWPGIISVICSLLESVK